MTSSLTEKTRKRVAPHPHLVEMWGNSRHVEMTTPASNSTHCETVRRSRSPALPIRPNHLLGVFARGVGQPGATQHAGDFFGALLAGDLANRRARTACRIFFLDQVVMIGERGDLRQMRHAQQLARAGETL